MRSYKNKKHRPFASDEAGAGVFVGQGAASSVPVPLDRDRDEAVPCLIICFQTPL